MAVLPIYNDVIRGGTWHVPWCSFPLAWSVYIASRKSGASKQLNLTPVHRRSINCIWRDIISLWPCWPYWLSWEIRYSLFSNCGGGLTNLLCMVSCKQSPVIVRNPTWLLQYHTLLTAPLWQTIFLFLFMMFINSLLPRYGHCQLTLSCPGAGRAVVKIGHFICGLAAKS